MTQKELAQKSGYSYAYIRQIESTQCSKKITIQALNDIAISLNTSIKNMFNDSDI